MGAYPAIYDAGYHLAEPGQRSRRENEQVSYHFPCIRSIQHGALSQFFPDDFHILSGSGIYYGILEVEKFMGHRYCPRLDRDIYIVLCAASKSLVRTLQHLLDMKESAQLNS